MTQFVLLITAVIIGACSSARLTMDGELEENENLIEPRLNPWSVFIKPKGKSTLKNLIQSFHEFDTRKKMSKSKIDVTKRPLSTPPSTERVNQLQTSTPPIKGGNLDKTNDKVSAPANSPAGVNYAKVIPSLHLQTEDNKKFIHSIIDGWNF